MLTRKKWKKARIYFPPGVSEGILRFMIETPSIAEM